MSFFDTLSEDGYLLTNAGYTALVVVILLLFLLGVFLFGSKKKKTTAKQMAFSAMAIALATVTSIFKLFDMPMGGSVTLCSMLFICLIGYWYGLGSGLTCAIAYGFLQLLIDPYIISLPQMLTDYVLAFGALGLAGLFFNKKYGLLKGYIVAVLGRYFFTFLSGWIFFGTYAPANFPNAVVYSLAYNGCYIGIEAAITIAIISIPQVTKALNMVKQYATDSQDTVSAKTLS